MDAYEQLVVRYSQLAFRTAYLVTASATDAEEAVQEAFVKAFRALPRFRPQAPFRPWLMRIVANEARNKRRSESRRAQLVLRVVEGAQAAETASPELLALSAIERRSLVDALNQMPHEDRLVIACRYFLELSTDETAAALGIPSGTVKSRLSRSLTKLRALLQGGDD